MATVDCKPQPPARDAARTRAAILEAAQALFATNGYGVTGVREVATKAGVSWALVRRYFGSKEGLLQAALDEVLQVQALIGGEREAFGVRVVDLFFQTESRPSPVATMMMASADPGARDLCCRMMRERISEPLAQWLGDEGAERALRLNILWTGFFATRQLLGPGSTEAEWRAVRLWLARVTQAIADEAP